MDDKYRVTLSDGTVKDYVYSPEVRESLDILHKQLVKNNYLLLGVFLIFFLMLIAFSLIYFQTGIIGRYLALGVCR